MWIHTRPRNEHELGILINLDLCSRASINRLGEKWFVEVMLGADAYPVAALATQDEAVAVLMHIFERLQAGEKALDLEAELEEPPPRQQADAA